MAEVAPAPGPGAQSITDQPQPPIKRPPFPTAAPVLARLEHATLERYPALTTMHRVPYQLEPVAHLMAPPLPVAAAFLLIKMRPSRPQQPVKVSLEPAQTVPYRALIAIHLVRL